MTKPLTSEEIWNLPTIKGNMRTPDDCGKFHNWLYTMQSTAVGELIVGAFCSHCGIYGLPKKHKVESDE